MVEIKEKTLKINNFIQIYFCSNMATPLLKSEYCIRTQFGKEQRRGRMMQSRLELKLNQKINMRQIFRKFSEFPNCFQMLKEGRRHRDGRNPLILHTTNKTLIRFFKWTKSNLSIQKIFILLYLQFRRMPHRIQIHDLR